MDKMQILMVPSMQVVMQIKWDGAWKQLVCSTNPDKSMLSLVGIFPAHPHLGELNASQALAWKRKNLIFEQRWSDG